MVGEIRQTDKQTGNQADRHTDRKSDRQTVKKSEIQKSRAPKKPALVKNYKEQI